MDKDKIVREIIELQRRLDRVRRQHTADSWIDLNLTRAQLKSLFIIAREGAPVNFRKLATGLRVAPSNATGIVDRLVEQGLLTRNLNPEDRRVYLLRLTGLGETLIANIREGNADHMLQILNRMNSDDLIALAQSLKPFVEAAESSSSDGEDGPE